MKPKKIGPEKGGWEHKGKTRPPEASLNEGVADAYRAVQPEGFADHPRSSIDAAQTDADVDDTIGGE